MPVPGASNITFAARTRGTFNVSNAPGGQIIKYNSVANPNFVRPFAEPPSQLKLQPPQSAPQALPNLRGASQPLPNLAELSKPTTTPLKPTISTGSGAVAAAGATVGVVASGGIASSVSSGNLITLAALIWASNAIQLYKLWGLSQPESQAELNIEVGQESALYEVEAYYNWVLGHFNEPRERPTGYYKGIAQGPIKEAISTYPTDPVGGFTFDNVRFALTGKDENGNDKAYPLPLYRTEPNQQVFASGYSHNYIESGGILGAKRVDGQVDPQPLPQRQRQAQPLPQQPFPEFADPEPPKPKGKVVLIPNLAPLPEKRSIRLEIPSNLPITITSPGQAPIQVQQPQNTSGDPTTVTIPRNISPGEDQPIQIQQPGGQPITFTSSSTSPFTINIPGYQPITIDPQKSGQPKGAIADPVQLGRFSPTPIPATAPTPGTPTNPGTTPTATPKPATTDDLEQFKKDLEKLLLGGTALAGLTPAIQAIGDRVNQTARQTTPEAIATAAETGTCNAFAPNGCNADIKSNAQKAADNSAANKTLLERLTDQAANLADLTLLPVINNKLGAQLPGGLAGASTRLSRFLGIDRIFNLLNFLAILHNASMLSSSLKVTLLETLSSVGNATGLLQTSEGDNVDLNQVFNQGLETFITSLIGVDAWASMKLTWRKYSSIYRAATNSLNAISSMFNSIGQAVETAAEYTGKIGNAIRAAGVVRENAYNFMSERFEVRNSNKYIAFQSSVGNTIQVLETVNEIAENIVEGQQQYTEAVKATADFHKQLSEAQKNPGIDNKAVKEEAEKIKANLVKDPTGEDEEGLLSFLTD